MHSCAKIRDFRGAIMQDTQDMIQRLNLSGKKLSKSHRRIAEYIVEHYDKAVFMTAAKLGEMVAVSESTVGLISVFRFRPPLVSAA